MLSKNTLLIGIFSLLGLGASNAQFGISGSSVNIGLRIADHLLIKEARDVLEGREGEKVEGSPYLNDDFIKGDIYSTKGSFPGIEMRYNIYSDNIEFRQDNLTYILDPVPEITKVDLGEYSLVVAGEESRGKMRPGYYVLLDSGKVTLLARKVISFREGRPPQALESAPTPAKFSELPDIYYYKIANGPLMKVGSLKKMIASLPDRQTELEKFASEEKISSRKEDDLTRLVRYYNSL